MSPTFGEKKISSAPDERIATPVVTPALSVADDADDAELLPLVEETAAPLREEAEDDVDVVEDALKRVLDRLNKETEAGTVFYIDLLYANRLML